MSAIAGDIGTGIIATIGAGCGAAYAAVPVFTAAGTVAAGASASGSEAKVQLGTIHLIKSSMAAEHTAAGKEH